MGVHTTWQSVEQDVELNGSVLVSENRMILFSSDLEKQKLTFFNFSVTKDVVYIRKK